MGLLGDAWDFYTANRDLVDPAFWGHVRLSVAALALAAVTGVIVSASSAPRSAASPPSWSPRSATSAARSRPSRSWASC